MEKTMLFLILILSVFNFGCSNEPEPINFNSDQCVHCKMTIEDTRFGAEIVTMKGKVLKFDAAECMVNYLNKGKISESDVNKYYVIDFSQPSTLVDASKSTFLISQNLPSPMGANLSAFISRNTAENQKSTSGGELYTWSELKQKLKR
ncbi:MAG: nitrous oxide reductase accessory protein NosL [Ignavibacteriae bacterium]|nr:nitrous oxide reductase accessory protein NosL [Ignavibacteriota bacterium]